MTNCAVLGCNNSNKKITGEKIKFYSFPKNKELALQWSNACQRRDKINTKYASICSRHFESKWFFTPLKYQLLKGVSLPKSFRNLLEDAVPTLFLPKYSNSISSSSSSSTTCSKERKSQRNPNKHDLENQQITNLNVLASNPSCNDGDCYAQSLEGECLTVVDLTGPDFFTSDKITELLNELKNVKTKMLSLEKEVKELKSKNVNLTDENKALCSKVLQYHTALHNHFTPSQIEQILIETKSVIEIR